MAEAASPSAPAGKVEPYIPASKTLPELTAGVIILGCLLSVILAGANAYLGMFAGMTVSASVPAAVISMGIFRALRSGNILQNNAVQTAAASGEGLAAGVIFTLPALILLGTWAHFSYVETTLIAGFGGILGVLFTIPLRRALIIEQPLQFPEGVATAEVLKVGAEGGGGVRLVLGAALLAAVAKVGSTGLKLWAETSAWATHVGKSAVSLSINMSPALLGVGFIVGINVATVIFAGAVVDRWIAVPLFSYLGDPSTITTDVKVDLIDFTQRVIHMVELGAHKGWDAVVQLHLVDKLNDHHRDLAEHLARKGSAAVAQSDILHKYATRYLGVGMML